MPARDARSQHDPRRDTPLEYVESPPRLSPAETDDVVAMKRSLAGAIMTLAVLQAVTTSSQPSRYFAVFQFLVGVSLSALWFRESRQHKRNRNGDDDPQPQS